MKINKFTVKCCPAVHRVVHYSFFLSKFTSFSHHVHHFTCLHAKPHLAHRHHCVISASSAYLSSHRDDNDQPDSSASQLSQQDYSTTISISRFDNATTSPRARSPSPWPAPARPETRPVASPAGPGCPGKRPSYCALFSISIEYCSLVMVDGVSRCDGRLRRLDERWICLCRAALRFPWTPANLVASAAGPR